MTTILATTGDRIADALSCDGVCLDRKSATHWAGSVLNGAEHPLEVHWDNGWLLFSGDTATSSRAAREKDLWEALSQNAANTTGIRTTLTEQRQLKLGAELLLLDDLDLGPRVRRVIEAFQMVWDGHAQPPTDAAADWAADIERRCEEAEWGCTRRTTGRLTVGLETTPVFQAAIIPAGCGVRLEVEVADVNQHSPTSRTAAAVIALETSARIRMVGATTDEAQSRAGFSVGFPNVPVAEELAAGFAALSAAVAATSETLAALQIENLARDYLAARGWPATKQNKKRERTNT